MCLGIPARIVDLDGGRPERIMVDISGSQRRVDRGLLHDVDLRVGDWVVVHMGFALERVSQEEAADGLEMLHSMGPGEVDVTERGT